MYRIFVTFTLAFAIATFFMSVFLSPMGMVYLLTAGRLPVEEGDGSQYAVQYYMHRFNEKFPKVSSVLVKISLPIYYIFLAIWYVYHAIETLIKSYFTIRVGLLNFLEWFAAIGWNIVVLFKTVYIHVLAFYDKHKRTVVVQNTNASTGLHPPPSSITPQFASSGWWARAAAKARAFQAGWIKEENQGRPIFEVDPLLTPRPPTPEITIADLRSSPTPSNVDIGTPPNKRKSLEVSSITDQTLHLPSWFNELPNFSSFDASKLSRIIKPGLGKSYTLPANQKVLVGKHSYYKAKVDKAGNTTGPWEVKPGKIYRAVGDTVVENIDDEFEFQVVGENNWVLWIDSYYLLLQHD